MKDNNQRTREYVARKKKAGFVRMYVWIKPADREKVKRYVNRMNKE